MSRDDEAIPAASTRPNFLLIAILVIAALIALFWFFLRSAWVPVLVNLDPQDAAEIAKVLDEKKIEYRFAAEGRTIEVAETEADRARIELAGSELPMKGQIGFELFNQSDMGLTEFAQKINYQRALQGELARTILLLDGIQTARVHLGLPERSVFRAEQDQPKASVTLILKPGKALSSATVLGIQRLVAGAVPDLSIDAVAVLDGSGRLISNEIVPFTAPPGSSDAVVESVRQRLVAIIAKEHPDLRFGTNVSLRYVQSARQSREGASEADNQEARPPRGAPDYVYAIRLTTGRPLDDDLRNDIQRLVRQNLDFDPARGDTLVFLVGSVSPDAMSQTNPSQGERIVAKAEVSNRGDSAFQWRDWWLVWPILAASLIGLAIWNDRRRARKHKDGDLGNFAEVLRQRLEAETGV